MNLIGLHDQVRCWDLKGESVSPPFAYAKRRAQWDAEITPQYRHPEWQERKESLWQRTKRILTNQRGLVGFDSGSAVPMWFGLPTGFGSTQFEAAINSAYTAGSAGAATGTRWISPTAKTVSYIYSYISFLQGVAILTTDIDCYLASDNSTTSAIKPTTASSLATGTYNPSSNLGWHIGPTFNTSISANTPYWSFVADTNASGTNYAWIMERYSTSFVAPYALENTANHASYLTSNGWSSVTQRGCVGKIVTCFSDGSATGDPFMTSTLSSSNTNDKGLYLGGLTNSLKIMGLGSDVNDTHYGTFKIYASGTSQGGSTLASGTVIGNAGSGVSLTSRFLSSPYTLAANTACRLIFASDGTATTTPRRAQISTVASGGSATDLQGAFPLQGTSYYTAWNGSSWTDTTSEFPIVYVWIQDQVAAVASGGLLTPRGMRGGF